MTSHQMRATSTADHAAQSDGVQHKGIWAIASLSAVKAEPEIIEIKSDDDNDDDDVQIIKRPAPPSTPPPPEKRKQRTPAARRTAGPDQAQSSASVPPTSSATLVPPEKRLLKRDAPWPEHFLRPKQAFNAVNAAYSFCLAHTHMVATFDTIRSSVEGLIKRPLEVSDIPQIRSLGGILVNFAYVEQEMLEVHMDARANGGEPTPATVKTWRGSRIDKVYRCTAEAVEG
ncbi:ATP-dependent 3'-5' DNA helicase [Thecaphora frezii]